MITVITGSPGSGKTLYAIAKLLKPMVGTFVEATDDDGNKVQHPRTIYSNINGLTLPHEKIDAEWLNDWPKRIKPGAVICYDEVQKPWPKRVTGSKVPTSVQELETHRHYGIDIVLMTQKPELVDQNACSLAGRHLHIRRVGNSHNVIVYEWDGVSRGLLFKNAFKKSPWRYPKWVFDWYKSAEAHTKMPRSLPAALWIAGLALAGSAYAWPTLLGKITEGFDPKARHEKTAQAASKADKPPTPSLVIPDQPEPPQGLAGALPALPALLPPSAPVLMGCAAAQDACRCYDQTGQAVELEPEACQAKLASPMPAKTGEQLPGALVTTSAPGWEANDAEALAAIRAQQR
jgi:zona occludens toxin